MILNAPFDSSRVHSWNIIFQFFGRLLSLLMECPFAGVLTRLVKKKHEDPPEASDEIEDSEAEQSDEIAEISESEAHEVMKRPKDREKRRGMASIMKDGARGCETSKKNSIAATAAHLKMTGEMLKYAKPNVSNVQEKDHGGSKEDEREHAGKCN